MSSSDLLNSKYISAKVHVLPESKRCSKRVAKPLGSKTFTWDDSGTIHLGRKRHTFGQFARIVLKEFCWFDKCTGIPICGEKQRNKALFSWADPTPCPVVSKPSGPPPPPKWM